MRTHRLYVGTIGEGVFRSLDGGRTFRRACEGMFVECHVRALAADPRDPATLYLGSEHGVFRSSDGADTWQPLLTPPGGLQVWSLWVAPHRPGLVLAGTCPPRIFLSEDGGETWTEAAAAMAPDCPRILHNRVTCLLGDPDGPEEVWAGVEIDGLHRSTDAGRTWQPVEARGLSSRDIHALAVVPGQPRTFLAATNNDVNVSPDGQSWQPLGSGRVLPWPYCRALAQVCCRPDVLLLGNGDAPPGEVGIVARSADGGRTWREAALPHRANSTLWNFAVHPADPDLVYASSVSGEVYRSLDAGQTWEQLPREFGEIRALVWTP